MCMMGVGNVFMYVSVQRYLHMYIFYKDVYVFEGRDMGFCVVCLGSCIWGQRKARFSQLNYTDLYEIDVGTCGLSRVVDSGVHVFGYSKYVSLLTFPPHHRGKAHYTFRKFCTVCPSLFFVWFIMLLDLTVSGYIEHVKVNRFVMFISWRILEGESIRIANKTPGFFPPCGLDLRSESFMFDIVPKITTKKKDKAHE